MTQVYMDHCVGTQIRQEVHIPLILLCRWGKLWDRFSVHALVLVAIDRTHSFLCVLVIHFGQKDRLLKDIFSMSKLDEIITSMTLAHGNLNSSVCCAESL